MEDKTTMLTQGEEKTLIGLLYNHLSFGTTMEVFGELTSEGIKRLANMRNIFSKLIKKFDIVKDLDENTFLVLGLTEFINRVRLEEFAKNDGNKHLQNRAKYFLNK